MQRETRFLIYVDKSVLTDPNALCDAVMAHFIKKGLDPARRRKFLVQFMHAHTDDEALGVVKRWVMVRDATTFPFRKKQAEAGTDVDDEYEEPQDEDEAVAGGIPVDDRTVGEPVEGDAPD